MFTGIIEETGEVESITPSRRAIQLVVKASRSAQGLKPGDSVAVNGSCLTVVKLIKRPRRNGVSLHFELLRETWRLTNLQFTQPKSLVNLERPLRASSRLDGHFVTGHIDGLGHI